MLSDIDSKKRDWSKVQYQIPSCMKFINLYNYIFYGGGSLFGGIGRKDENAELKNTLGSGDSNVASNEVKGPYLTTISYM